MEGRPEDLWLLTALEHQVRIDPVGGSFAQHGAEDVAWCKSSLWKGLPQDFVARGESLRVARRTRRAAMVIGFLRRESFGF